MQKSFDGLLKKESMKITEYKKKQTRTNSVNASIKDSDESLILK